MRSIVSAHRMAEIDRRSAAEFGLTAPILMEDAGLKAVIHLLHHEFGGALPPGRFVFLAGKGNNGGDALVMARHFLLLGKAEVLIILGVGPPLEGSAPAANLRICRSLGMEIYDWREEPEHCRALLKDARFIFDGLLGTGLKDEAAGTLKDLIETINAHSARVISIDVPSGVGDAFRKGASAIRADLTLTFGLPKLCVYLPSARPFAGRIEVVDPGFPPDLLADPSIPGVLLEPDDFDRLLPAAAPEAHKDTRGHLAVFAGSPGTSGAALLASQAAARSRVGLVTLYTDPAVYPSAAARLVSVMCRPVSHETLDTQALVARHRALLIGPGFGLSDEKNKLFERLIGLPLPKVVDADGLTLLAALGASCPAATDTPLILTPHPGECARLLGTSTGEILDAPVESVLAASRRFRAVCILKSHVTYIGALDGRYSVVDGMNPALGTAGSGDILAGLAAAFLAQGLDAYESARLSVLLHLRIGALAFRAKGFFLAEDLLEYISQAVTGPSAGHSL